MKWLVKLEDEIYKPMFRTDSPTLPRGGDWYLMEGPKTKYPKVEEVDGTLVVVEDDPKFQLAEAWVEMDKAIVDKAAPIFKTSNRESMLAFVDDFQLRIMVPEKFVDLGEFAEIDTESFGSGEVLDTAEKIKGYYSEVLFDLLQYRRVKIIDYLIVKAGLGL